MTHVATSGLLAVASHLLERPDATTSGWWPRAVDGQHRAMALLAIQRTRDNEWGDAGSNYKHFYEDLGFSDKLDPNIATLTLPICLCFFPSLTANNGSGQTPKRVCRKLFLDVNRTAKRPTKARTLLLDDSNIVAVLARGILSTIRGSSKQRSAPREITIDAFEYDSPKEAPVPRRELAVCSMEMLSQLVFWSVFAPDSRYNLGRRQTESRGRKPKANVQRFLREIDADGKITTAEAFGWGYTDFENEFDPSDCPIVSHEPLIRLYNATWGGAILKFLEALEPFSAHIRATASLRAGHDAEPDAAGLAYKALFDGQGILWTVMAHAKQRQEDRKHNSELPKAQIEKAYDIIQNWISNEFEMTRAAFLLDCDPKKVSNADKESATRSFRTFRTQAFQIGTLMAFTYLKESLRRTNHSKTTEELVGCWIDAWNRVFCGSKTTRAKRVRAFDKDEKEFPGLMGSYSGTLKPSHWQWFQYFTFEYLAASELDFEGRSEAREAASTLRLKYLKFKAKQYRDSQKKDTGKDINEREALLAVTPALCTALKNSVGMNKKDFDTWFAQHQLEFQKEDFEASDDEFDEDDFS